MIRLSVILDWDFILHLWLQMKLHIDTLSYKEGATAVHWACDGGTEYDMQEGRQDRQLVQRSHLFLNEDSLEFANEYRMREVFEKYCSFMPVNIYLSKANAEPGI